MSKACCTRCDARLHDHLVARCARNFSSRKSEQKKTFQKKFVCLEKGISQNQQNCSCIDETKAYIFAVNPRAVRDKSM